jgi:MFS family permease
LALGAMDITARTGYQMGKSPVLTVLALTVGAGNVELGLIASASVATGVVLKPWIGALSDRIGRCPLLMIAGALFALVLCIRGRIPLADGGAYHARFGHGRVRTDNGRTGGGSIC